MKEKFYNTKEAYVKATKDESPCKYECMECGTTFWGRWHSQYSMSVVECPTCGSETDPMFIKVLGNVE